MTGDGRRTRRVAEALRTHLAEALGREVADPRLASVVITDVTVSDDLSVARVGVRLLVGDEDPGQRRSIQTPKASSSKVGNTEKSRGSEGLDSSSIPVDEFFQEWIETAGY